MEHRKKKELAQAWKNRHAEMGVICMTCNATEESFLGISKDIPRTFNRVRFQLGAKIHPNKSLQRLWTQYGEAGFTCSVIKILEYKDGEEYLDEKLELLLARCRLEMPEAGKL